jgi:hypothetical protein
MAPGRGRLTTAHYGSIRSNEPPLKTAHLAHHPRGVSQVSREPSKHLTRWPKWRRPTRLEFVGDANSRRAIWQNMLENFE